MISKILVHVLCPCPPLAALAGEHLPFTYSCLTSEVRSAPLRWPLSPRPLPAHNPRGARGRVYRLRVAWALPKCRRVSLQPVRRRGARQRCPRFVPQTHPPSLECADSFGLARGVFFWEDAVVKFSSFGPAPL